MPEEDPTDEREDVEIEDDEVEESTVETDEDVTVEETLEVDEEGVEEEISITEEGEERATIEEEISVETERSPLSGTRERIEEEADRAVEGFDERIVDMLSWVLDTETRARIYVHLRQHPYSTSQEVAEGTGLYPSTVREALAELHDEGRLERRKRESEGAGNNPYEYTAIAPSELVGSVIGQVQDGLNAVFNMDRRLGKEPEIEVETEPVSIRVEDETSEGVGEGGSDEADETDGTDEF